MNKLPKSQHPVSHRNTNLGFWFQAIRMSKNILWIISLLAGCWFQTLNEKIHAYQSSPNRDENKKCFKPPPSFRFLYDIFIACLLLTVASFGTAAFSQTVLSGFAIKFVVTSINHLPKNQGKNLWTSGSLVEVPEKKKHYHVIETSTKGKL